MNPRLTLLAVSAAAAAVLSACSSSGGGATPAASPPPSNRAAASTAAAGAAAPRSSAAPTTAGAQTVSVKGGHLVGPGGRALYLLTSDRPGHPACSGACLQTWPPLTGTGRPAAGVRDNFATVARGTGTQITFDKHPLYMFAGDAAPGDTKGNGIKAFGGTWELATVSGKAGSEDRPSTAPASSARGGYGYP